MKRAISILFIIMFLGSSLFPIIPAEENPDQIVTTSGQYGKGYRYNIQGWVYVHIEGDPYERGFQYGYLTAHETQDMLERWIEWSFKSVKLLNLFSFKNPEKLWNIFRTKSMNNFYKYVPEEYREEMKGLTDGLNERGIKIFDREIEFEDIVASQFVQDVYYSSFEHAFKRFHPIRSIFDSIRDIFSGSSSDGKIGRCNVFIATGDATVDGGIIVTHATVFGGQNIIPQRANILLDVTPTEGHRFLMACPPGSIWSQEDWYQNEKGIILTETEFYIQGPWKKRAIPKGVRSRSAIQYSASIDDVIEILMDGNNGLIPNEWLIGDSKTGEIASLEQALFNTPIKRTFDGYYWSCCVPHSVAVEAELRQVPKIFVKIGRKISPPRDVAVKLIEVGEQYYGKIDLIMAKKIMATYPITKFTTDCKITSSDLIDQLGLIAFMGMPNGTQWNPPEKQINKYDKVTILPASGWLEIYPSDIDSIFFQSSDISNNILENGKVLWTSETGEAGNINYSSSAISEDAVYTVSLSGEIYAYEKENGKQIWSLNIGDNSIEPAVSKELVFVGSERGLHAIDKDTGRIKWEKLVGEISSKPVVSEDLVITSCSDGNIYCYSIDSGEKKWSYEFGEGAFISDVQQGKIYAGSGNSCYAFDISKESVIWEYETDKKITASPKISGNTVYVGSWDGNLYAINSVTGFLKWKYQTGWAIDSTPDVSDNTVFVGSLDNNFYAFDEKSGELKWFFTCKSAIHSSPVAYGEYVFFGCDDGRFYALNKEGGQLEWSYAPGYYLKDDDVNNYIVTPILSNPVVEDGVVYFGAKGTIYALDAQTEEKPEVKTPDELLIDGYLILLLIAAIIFILAVALVFKIKKR